MFIDKNKQNLKIAYIISRIFEPFWLIIIMGLVVVFSRFFEGYDRVLWGVGLLLFLGVLPVLAIFLGMKRGKIVDIDFTKREDRTPFIMSVLGFWIIGWILVWALQGPEIMFAVLLSSIIIGILVLVINLYWKVSNHALAIAAVFLFINANYSWRWWWLLLFIPLVWWARWIQKKHTWEQLLGGTILGVLFVFLIKIILA